MDFNEVMDRVSLVIEKELKMKPKDNVIAKYLGISSTNFANLKNRNSIPYKEIIYFSAKYKVSTNWIFFGQQCCSLVEEEEKYYSLKVIDKINASCGGGSFEDSNIEYSYVKLHKQTLEKLGYGSANALEAIRVVGDSMLPTLKDKDLILIDRSKNKYNTSGLFLVNTIDDGLFVKRLKTNGDKIDLISDNKDYAILTLCVDEVTILGKVLGVLNLNENSNNILNFNNQTSSDKDKIDKIDKIDINLDIDSLKFSDDENKFLISEEYLKIGDDSENDEFSSTITNSDDYRLDFNYYLKK